MNIDTGASHTGIDLAALIVAGYGIENAADKVQLETGNGVVEAYVLSSNLSTKITYKHTLKTSLTKKQAQ